MIDVIFCVPTAPKGKGSARSCVVNGRTHVYTARTDRVYMHEVGAAAAEVFSGYSKITSAVRVDICAVLPRPKRLCTRTAPPGLIYAPRKPDADNIRKALLDGLRGIWADDALVVDGRTVKVYAERYGEPRVIVRVQTLGDVPGLIDLDIFGIFPTATEMEVPVV